MATIIFNQKRVPSRAPLALALALLAVGRTAAAESFTGGQNKNPFENTITTSERSQFFQSTDNIVDNSAGNAANGREYKLGDAERQAAAGTGAAIASGASLTAAAVAAMAQMDFETAGRYFGMAGQQFAQAGASAAAGNQNGAQRATLLMDDGQSGRQSFNPAEIAGQLLTPEARQAFQAQGIDAESFMSQLAAGGIRSGSDALAAIGQDATAFPTVNETAGVDLSWLPSAKEELGEMSRQAVGMEDGPLPTAALEQPENGQDPLGGGMGNLGMRDSGRGLNAQSADRTLSLGENKALLARGPAAGANGAGGKNKLTALLPEKGAFPFFNKGGKEADLAASGLSRSSLLALGVSTTRGQNIFHLAERNYRSFRQWRVIRKARNARSRGLASTDSGRL